MSDYITPLIKIIQWLSIFTQYKKINAFIMTSTNRSSISSLSSWPSTVSPFTCQLLLRWACPHPPAFLHSLPDQHEVIAEWNPPWGSYFNSQTLFSTTICPNTLPSCSIFLLTCGNDHFLTFSVLYHVYCLSCLLVSLSQKISTMHSGTLVCSLMCLRHTDQCLKHSEHAVHVSWRNK